MCSHSTLVCGIYAFSYSPFLTILFYAILGSKSNHSIYLIHFPYSGCLSIASISLYSLNIKDMSILNNTHHCDQCDVLNIEYVHCVIDTNPFWHNDDNVWCESSQCQ